jgi:WD40 repeat protein
MISLWDIDSEERILSFYGHESAVYALDISSDGKYLASASTDNTAMVFDMATGLVTMKLEGHRGRLNDVQFSPDSRQLLTASSDGTARLWDIERQKEIVAFTAVGEEDYIAVIPDQYYLSSKGAASGLAFIAKDEAYPFDQFDLALNRPDRVLAKIGQARPYLIKAYAQAHQKRLRKFGMTDAVSVSADLPEVGVQDDLPQATNAKQLALNITGTDANSPITQLLVKVNDVPIFGQSGLRLSDPSKQITNVVPITLSNGRNSIQVSVRNALGQESLRQTREVTYTGPQSEPTLHVVVIGVSDYIDEGITDLAYAAKDANDMADQFVNQYRFGEVVEHRLLNGDATRANIAALKDVLMKTNVDDQVV